MGLSRSVLSIIWSCDLNTVTAVTTWLSDISVHDYTFI